VRRLGFAAALMVSLTWGIPPASATLSDHFRYTQPYNDVRWDCGYAMSVVGVETHQVVVRADRKLDGG